MSKPTIKIAVPPRKYGDIETLAQAVILSMTGNANFPAPSPSLVTLQTALDPLSDAITAWGTVGHRGSRIDIAVLRDAAITLRELLIKEAAYITNLLDPTASEEAQTAFLISSGFAVMSARKPQGRLEEVQEFRHYISRSVNVHEVKLRWKRPLNMRDRGNVNAYLIFRSMTGMFADAVFIGAATQTMFLDSTPVLGALNSYFVVPFNYAGNGITSNVVTVSVPA